MRFDITLTSSKEYIDLPLNYNYLIQSAIYNSISKKLASFLHDYGFVINNRKFSLFVFSRIQGDYKIYSKLHKIRFNNQIKISIASPISHFIEELGQIILQDGLVLQNQFLKIEGIETISSKIITNKITVQSLSPVVAYSTLTRDDGMKYTLYFQPKEKEFSRIVIENLKKKARIIYGENIEFEDTTIRYINEYKKDVSRYKKTMITGYLGNIVLEGDIRLLQTALDTGLGSKNSMGYGFIEVINWR